MNRRWLITFSLLAHTGLGIGLFVAGVWRIERLDQPKMHYVIGVPLPAGAEPEGGSAKAAAEKLEKKEKKKRIVKDAQPVPKEVKAPQIAAADTTGELGDGAGKGSGSGDTDGPPGGESCDDPLGCGEGTSGGNGGDPVCGNGTKEAGETCDDGNASAGDGCSASCKVEVKTLFVAPTVLQGLRISGETQVHAPDTVKTTMLRDGRERTVGVLKLCIAVDGGISSVSVVGSTKYEAYDAKLVAAARAWRYKPYTVNGTPMPVCGMVTFVYTIR
jgi:TonB family protein